MGILRNTFFKKHGIFGFKMQNITRNRIIKGYAFKLKQWQQTVSKEIQIKFLYAFGPLKTLQKFEKRDIRHYYKLIIIQFITAIIAFCRGVPRF